jgi:hypothetical protein
LRAFKSNAMTITIAFKSTINRAWVTIKSNYFKRKTVKLLFYLGHVASIIAILVFVFDIQSIKEMLPTNKVERTDSSKVFSKPSVIEYKSTLFSPDTRCRFADAPRYIAPLWICGLNVGLNQFVITSTGHGDNEMDAFITAFINILNGLSSEVMVLKIESVGLIKQKSYVNFSHGKENLSLKGMYSLEKEIYPQLLSTTVNISNKLIIYSEMVKVNDVVTDIISNYTLSYSDLTCEIIITVALSIDEKRGKNIQVADSTDELCSILDAIDFIDSLGFELVKHIVSPTGVTYVLMGINRENSERWKVSAQ